MSRTIEAEDVLIAFVLKYMKWPKGKDYHDIRTEFYKISNRLYVEIDRDSVRYVECNHLPLRLKEALEERTRVAPLSKTRYGQAIDHISWCIERLDVVTDEQREELTKAFIPQMTYEEYAEKWVHRNKLTDQAMVKIYKDQALVLRTEINDVIRVNTEKIQGFEKLIKEKELIIGAMNTRAVMIKKILDMGEVNLPHLQTDETNLGFHPKKHD